MLDGSINIFKLSTLLEVPSINLGNIKNEFLQKNMSEKFLGMPRIISGLLGERREHYLCALLPPNTFGFICSKQWRMSSNTIISFYQSKFAFVTNHCFKEGRFFKDSQIDPGKLPWTSIKIYIMLDQEHLSTKSYLLVQPIQNQLTTQKLALLPLKDLEPSWTFLLISVAGVYRRLWLGQDLKFPGPKKHYG